MDYIPMLALGAIFLVLGCFNIKGNISSIHWYNRRKGCLKTCLHMGKPWEREPSLWAWP